MDITMCQEMSAQLWSAAFYLLGTQQVAASLLQVPETNNRFKYRCIKHSFCYTYTSTQAWFVPTQWAPPEQEKIHKVKQVLKKTKNL